jgi:hypothetical protein
MNKIWKLSKKKDEIFNLTKARQILRVEKNAEMEKIEEDLKSSLVEIIDRIENQRIMRMNKLQEMKIGLHVQYGNKAGLIIEISQKSIIVEFNDKTKRRFFMNKRKNHETLENLSLINFKK